MLGINQTIMLAISMLVITALVGTRDLGQEVYIALAKADTGRGIVAGLCVAFIAIIADRLIGAGPRARPRAAGPDMSADAKARAAGLSCWSGPVDPQPLKGGITNANFVVEDEAQRFVVRIGDDIPVHGVMRFNELAAAGPPHAAGISPAVVHHEPGALVMRHHRGPRPSRPRTSPSGPCWSASSPLIGRCHREMPKHLRGPALIFWVFHVAARLCPVR